MNPSIKSQNSNNNDINLRDMILIIWAHRYMIFFSCIIFLGFGANYVLNTSNKYTSSVIFKPSTNKNENLSSKSGIDGLALLTGLSNDNLNSVSEEEIKGRVFIEQIDKILNLKGDIYFNKYLIKSDRPYWKFAIKRLTGWKPKNDSTEELIWQEITKKFKKNLLLEETDNGSAQIFFTHENPNRAAFIANTIMGKVLDDRASEDEESRKKQLNYLTTTLAEALNELENAQSKLKRFALENSALPLEDFAAGSVELDLLREQLSKTKKLYEAVIALKFVLDSKNISEEDYIKLRKNYPIIDQAEFRRVFGQNEIISTWDWPKKTTVLAIRDTLEERKNMLQSKIEASQINAKRSGEALEIYSKLKRDAQISEVTYNVLVEQVKAESLLNGFTQNNSKIYETAAPPSQPSTPNGIIILPVCLLFGLMFGVAIALVRASIQNVIYSKETLIKSIQPIFYAKCGELMRLRYRSLDDMSKILQKWSHSSLRDLVVEIHKNDASQIIITSENTKLKSNELARMIVNYIRPSEKKIAIINFSSNEKKLNINQIKIIKSLYREVENNEYTSILAPEKNQKAVDFIGQVEFMNNLDKLRAKYEKIIICADNREALTLLSAVQKTEYFHIMLARTKYSRSDIIEQMVSIIPVKGLLYE